MTRLNLEAPLRSDAWDDRTEHYEAIPLYPLLHDFIESDPGPQWTGDPRCRRCALVLRSLSCMRSDPRLRRDYAALADAAEEFAAEHGWLFE